MAPRPVNEVYTSGLKRTVDEYPRPRTNQAISLSINVRIPDFFAQIFKNIFPANFDSLRSAKIRQLKTTLELTRDHGFLSQQAYITRTINTLLKWGGLLKSVQQFRRLPLTTEKVVLALYIYRSSASCSANPIKRQKGAVET